ncbi:MAG TPA: sodium:alanine symporter family protein [Atribacterota bacterium]|nr:sodium:alanine symporter family protein [Atribacterota bacterium]
MDAIMEFLDKINAFAWGPPMMILLVGTGIYLTIRIGGVQFTKMGYAWKITFASCFKKDKEILGEGEITFFQSLCSALSATVGNGNIAGVATAIAAGGPGAAVWMWITALFGMATKLAEATLGVKYRIKDKDGAYVGGAMYYITNGLGQKWLGWLFALFGGIAAFGIGCMVQTNSMALVGKSVFNIPPWISGVILTILTWLVVIGGIKRIGEVTELLVPFMAIFYIVAGLTIIVVKINMLPWALGEIFRSAFTGRAAFGGFAGSTVAQAMRYGVARGIFSNEAGLGSASMAHAVAKTKHPVRQGMMGTVEVNLDTLIICSMTAIVIVITDSLGTGLTSTALTAHAFSTVLKGIGGPVVALGSILFGYSTVISWCYYGQTCGRFILGPSVATPYAWIFIVLAFLGAVVEVPFVWLLTDTLNGLMAIPNLIGLIFLGGIVAKEVKEYFSHPEYLG